MDWILSPKIAQKIFRFCNIVIRNKSFNSHDWLKRREVDRYVELSKQQNFRCRSAFKLIEINDRYQIIQPGFKALDIGAAPGSWSQVLAQKTNSNGKDENLPVGFVIAVDLSLIHPIDGVVILSKMDFNLESSQNKILEVLGKDNKFDVICSDMAPSSSGVKSLDQDRIIRLVYPVILFSVKHLTIGGSCLVKIWDGGESGQLKQEMKRFFRYTTFTKPKASYASSSEIYILGREFIGLKT